MPKPGHKISRRLGKPFHDERHNAGIVPQEISSILPHARKFDPAKDIQIPINWLEKAKENLKTLAISVSKMHGQLKSNSDLSTPRYQEAAIRFGRAQFERVITIAEKQVVVKYVVIYDHQEKCFYWDSFHENVTRNR